MPREHLFDIQELRDHVAQHMESRDYRQCALVCRSWQEGFQPLVWERVVVHLQSNFPVGSMGQCPPERIAAFHRNAHWIRHLSFSKYRGHCLHGELSGILAAQCRSLVSLDTTDTPENFWPFIGMLLVLNTSIERVRVKLLTSTLEYPQQLKSVLGGHSRLRQLELCVSLTAAALADILDACPSLYEVHVTQIIEGTSAYWNATGATKAQDHTLVHRPPYGLKRVMLSASCRDPAINDLILARCPSLEMLRIHSLEGLAAGKFRRLVRAGCFPKLTDFWLDCSRGDLCLKELFNDFPENQLRRVQLTWPVGDDIGACVERNHASLEEFELLRYGYVIACSIIPLLPMFRCDRLKTLTLTSGLDVRQLLTQPWSCWNLETLRLQSTNLTKDCKIQELWDAASDEKQDIAPGEPEWEQVELVLLRRIGTLINLRHLEVNLLYEPRHRVHGFAEPTPLIKSCKGILEHCSLLESFILGGRYMVRDVADIQVVKAHLPRLWALSCGAPKDQLPTLLTNGVHPGWPNVQMNLSPLNNEDIYGGYRRVV